MEAAAVIVVRLLGLLAVAYVAIVVLMYLGQSRLLHLPYLPGRALVATPEHIGLPYQDIRFAAEDAVALHGWFVPAANARATLLFFHGNAGNISHRLDSLRIFHDLGLSTFIFDYRGYGQSDGRPSEAGLYADARAAWAHLTEDRGVDPTHIIAFGRSLGGAVAACLARERPLGALILESTFTSVPDLGAELYPWLPVRRLARLNYDARACVAGVEVPVLVVHSPDDEIIPFRHGEALAAAAGSGRGPGADLLEISGDHNTGFLRSGERYRRGLERFLAGLDAAAANAPR
jgi:uncharacterized protein